MESFLVKIGSVSSILTGLIYILGALLGVFIAMINYFETDCPTVKYIDNTTLFCVSNEPEDNTLKSDVDTATIQSGHLITASNQHQQNQGNTDII